MAKRDDKAQYIKISELKPYENNARTHSNDQIEAICNSIKEFGFINPVIIDENNMILVGHGRIEAAKVLGLDEAPYRRVTNLTEDQKRAYILADNKLSDLGGWDEDLLAQELGEIELDMSLFGFDNVELEDLDFNTGDIEEDEIPDIDEDAEPKSKRGEIYKLGNHYLLCGDATSKDDINKILSFNNNTIDIVFTDPPYGNGVSGKYGRGRLGIRTIIGDKNLDTFTSFIELMDCNKIIYFLQWRTLIESFEALDKKGLKINTVAVWDKKNAGLNGRGGISEQWEAVIFAGDIKYKKFGGNVFTIAREHKKREDLPHPHQKPIKLIAEIFDFIDDCKTVFDPFGGSGSTLIACEQLGKACYCMELDPKYIDVIIQRWENLTGKKAELIKEA